MLPASQLSARGLALGFQLSILGEGGLAFFGFWCLGLQVCFVFVCSSSLLAVLLLSVWVANLAVAVAVAAGSWLLAFGSSLLAPGCWLLAPSS
ncbi:hypothetical protein B0H66DRAFT_542365 [Apodospora peruviana]|uniref:Uncharacterized protein n=1 Tax=Apodospora peruviana TaxID=516989 RepID=A0AAE0IRX3_9PEZI|nr:hypothetical protein B0H66DRAFT_542365 [Apodospora peruviana]